MISSKMSKAEVGLIDTSKSGVGGLLTTTGRPDFVEGVYCTCFFFGSAPVDFFKMDLGCSGLGGSSRGSCLGLRAPWAPPVPPSRRAAKGLRFS